MPVASATANSSAPTISARPGSDRVAGEDAEAVRRGEHHHAPRGGSGAGPG